MTQLTLQVGAVTKLSDTIVHVQFDDGSSDYGRRDAVTVVKAANTIKVGDRVRVTAYDGGLFYSRNRGKEGVVTRVDVGFGQISLRFDDGTTDYGRIRDVLLAKEKATVDAQGFISNTGNTSGELPFPRGTKLDVLYNDGSIILDLPIGDGTRKTSVNFPRNEYSATSWAYFGGGTSIKGYRLPSERPGRIVSHEQMVKGMKVRLTNDGNGRHNHWGFLKGEVYNCVDGGPLNGRGERCSRNWGEWIWEVVENYATLDAQLASLKAELVVIKAAKADAEQAVKDAQEVVATKVLVVEAEEAKRVALITRLSAHGIQFINEEPVKAPRTALEAFEAGELEVGMTLLCVTPEDDDEHTAGREYKITDRDEGDSSEFNLESNDGYGWWIRNSSLAGYTVVV